MRRSSNRPALAAAKPRARAHRARDHRRRQRDDDRGLQRVSRSRGAASRSTTSAAASPRSPICAACRAHDQDRRLVHRADRPNRADETIIKAIIDLCHGLGKRVVGEGVETEAPARLPRGAGLRRGAGLPVLPLRCRRARPRITWRGRGCARRDAARTQPTLVTAGSALSGRLEVAGVAPGRVPFLLEDVGDPAALLEEPVRHLEDAEHQAAVGRPGLVAAAGRPPDEVAGGAIAVVVGEHALEHEALLGQRVLVVGQPGARRHPDQRGDRAGLPCR